MKLSCAIDLYAAHMRSFGFSFITEKTHLTNFCRYSGDVGLDQVTSQVVANYMESRSLAASTWRAKHGVLRRFFEHWHVRGQGPKLTLPTLRRPEQRRFLPHIYTQGEIRSLLLATTRCQARKDCKMDAATFRMLLLTLYATGACVGEVLDLRLMNLDLRRSRITIEGRNGARHRCLPICPELRHQLKIFLRERRQNKDPRQRVFCNVSGGHLSQRTLIARFNILRRLSGISRRDGVRIQPRMIDLRHTFAVHRITAWIRSDSDLNRMLPALAAYIGNVSLHSAEQYLSLTSERFRRTLETLGGKRGKKHWRDNPALMKFLTSL